MGQTGTRNASKTQKNKNTIFENDLKTPPKEPKRFIYPVIMMLKVRLKKPLFSMLIKRLKGILKQLILKMKMTPECPKTTKNIWFKMATGYEIAYNKAAIQDLKDEWGEFILEFKSFKTKEEATKYIIP